MKKMKVTAVTVTYGDRFAYLHQVILSAFAEGVDEVVVVSNGSDHKTLQGLAELQQLGHALKVIENKNNLGSAMGFKQGIEAASDTNTDFIWLLDDDNKPLNNALGELKTIWSQLAKKENSTIALLSYRADRKLYKDAIAYKNSSLMLGSKNSFLGFNGIQKITSLFGKKQSMVYDSSIEVGTVAVAPYGGLFFHSSLIEKIGLPDTNYFLYGDDFDFSYRITKKGGTINLVLASKLEDLEKSFHLKEKKAIINNRYLKTESVNRIYYSVRNGIRFEQNFVNNKLVYTSNGIIYTASIFVALLINYKHFWKFKYILKGIINSRVDK